MTRGKALEVANLLYKIEAYETLQAEIKGLKALEDIYTTYGDEGEIIESELVAVVQNKIDKLLEKLEEM